MTDILRRCLHRRWSSADSRSVLPTACQDRPAGWWTNLTHWYPDDWP